MAVSINLYEHNETAYKAVVSMLGKCGKAAVIHPTGTGKSFIAFKLCEDNPDKSICWLSPSEYIFKTQLENLKKTANGYVPENIHFFTYARLVNMEDEELEGIKPDYIILDEFHRCGARVWGQGVQSFLEKYPDTPILGLSATAIRYLDNQRDMSDELFDGLVASEISLGEAVVRGILTPPKYVLSVFSYKKEYEKYEKRIKSSKNKLVREKGERYLETLRRTLEQADGLKEIFSKHMTDKTGKYIVFCASYEHMREMIELSQEWFCEIDSNPHIYTAYSNDAKTNREFQAFKNDNSSRLKLLYCIDMLNEGIHVDEISGVILLRPTVSPIVYKQQIGRALSASGNKNAVIFDVVLNIENLYSIGEIEEEMQLATAYYRSLGEEDEIINERFEVIDEVHDCIELFNRLDNVLSASWELMYNCAKQYYNKNGNLEVPAGYFTEDGYSLGSWIHNQRSIRKGQTEGRLTEEQIDKLNRIGMRWDLFTDYSWTMNFNAAKEYFKIHGNLDVSSRYVTEDGIKLGPWLSNLRTWESSGIHLKYLTEERKKALEEIGMIWSKFDYYWENNYNEAAKYYRENGDLLVSDNYISDRGIRLGSWISRLRKLRNGQCKGTPLTNEQIERLNKIGMVWEYNNDRRWDDAYDEAKKYYKQNGNLIVPSAYKTESGFTLGQWVQNQRKYYKKGMLNESRILLLNKINMIWDMPDPWLFRYKLVKDYYDRNGNTSISQKVIVDGVWIGKWIVSQKKLYDLGIRLTKEQRRLLEILPLEQISCKDRAWLDVYNDALDFYKKYNNLRVPPNYRGSSGKLLSDWIFRQRSAYKKGKLTNEQIEMVKRIGIVSDLTNSEKNCSTEEKEFYNINEIMSWKKKHSNNKLRVINSNYNEMTGVN